MLPQYYSLNEYLVHTFGQKVYKLAIEGGMTCPNRDGLLGSKGCIFCSEGGSGEFTSQAYYELQKCNITEQIDTGKMLLSSKYKGNAYIAYFQSYTNTYASIDYLNQIYMEAVSHPDVVCLSIATRPDCLSDEVIELLKQINTIKPVWIELGLQTIHERTARYIRRGYPLSVFTSSLIKLKQAKIYTIVHVILGLPGESEQDMYETVRYLSKMEIDGIKLQLLHVLRHTDLATDYAKGLFEVLTLEDYVRILGNMIKMLPQDICIHRLTGDGAKNLLIAPLWSANKKNVLNTIHHDFKIRNIRQGSEAI